MYSPSRESLVDEVRITGRIQGMVLNGGVDDGNS